MLVCKEFAFNSYSQQLYQTIPISSIEQGLFYSLSKIQIHYSHEAYPFSGKETKVIEIQDAVCSIP
jgi:hypothetical protein